MHPLFRMSCCTLVLLLAAGTAGADPLPKPDNYGDRITIQKDVQFGSPGKPHQTMDIYLPRGDGPFPAVVCWFGGGFTGGNKGAMAAMCALLADKGFVAAAPGYRLADVKQERYGWPQNLHDAKCAVRYLRAHAAKYKVDADHIAGLGHSSGAYLAMMVGFTSGKSELEGSDGWPDVSSKLSAVVNIAGVSDRRGKLGTGTLNLLGKGYEDKADLRALASPVVQVSKDSPPVYTLHGADDKTVLPESAQELDAALKKAGVAHELHIIPGKGHNPIDTGTIAPVVEWLKKLNAK